MEVEELFETSDSVKVEVLWHQNQINKIFNKTRGDVNLWKVP